MPIAKEVMYRIVERLQYMHINSVILLASTAFILCSSDRPATDSGFKIVSLSPAMTEILFALHAQNLLVGVTTFCDYPEQAKGIYKVGDFSNPSLERIVGLKPDLVIVNLPEQLRTKNQLERLQIKTFISSPKSLADMYREIAEIGKIVNKESVAESLINAMKTQIKPSEGGAQKRVYIELSPRPIVTIGRYTFLNEMLELAGGVNIFSDLKKDYPVVSQEEIIKRNPEIIILLHPYDIADRVGWMDIEAIESKRIYRNLNRDALMRPGPRLVEGFRALRKVLNE